MRSPKKSKTAQEELQLRLVMSPAQLGYVQTADREILVIRGMTTMSVMDEPKNKVYNGGTNRKRTYASLHGTTTSTLCSVSWELISHTVL